MKNECLSNFSAVPRTSSKQPDDRVDAAFSFEAGEGLAGQVKGGESQGPTEVAHLVAWLLGKEFPHQQEKIQVQDVEEKGAFPEDLQGVFAVAPELSGPGESRYSQKRNAGKKQHVGDAGRIFVYCQKGDDVGRGVSLRIKMAPAQMPLGNFYLIGFFF